MSVHTSFDMNLMKDSRSFVNLGQADTLGGSGWGIMISE